VRHSGEILLEITYFAPAERSVGETLHHQIDVVCSHPMMDGLLQLVGGCIAVLNAQRQIVALNQTLIALLGLEDVQDVLGLRLGEALGCLHAGDMPGGCGTGQACLSCGAAITIVSTLGSNRPAERTCSVSIDRHGQPMDLYFLVHASPLRLNNQLFVLLFLQDISRRQQLEALERVFFHDVNNTLMGLLTASDLLLSASGEEMEKMAKFVRHFAVRLHQELSLQRYLIGTDIEQLELQYADISIDAVFEEIQRTIGYHPAAMGKRIQRRPKIQNLSVCTDIHLLQRVLVNMLINAVEATPSSQTVWLDAQAEDGKVVFSVWNPTSMPPEIAQRIFQKNFSSKGQLGRGLGTYSMKLFGEKILGGQLSFTTTPQNGTTFYFALPVKPPKSQEQPLAKCC
jgi:signal transduction histidine kinase